MTPGVTSVPSLLRSSSQLGDTANSSCQLIDCVSAVHYSSSPRGQIQFIQANICLFIPSSCKQIIRQYLLLVLSSDKVSAGASLHHGGFTSILCTFSPISNLNTFLIRFSPFVLVPIRTFSLSSHFSLGLLLPQSTARCLWAADPP